MKKDRANSHKIGAFDVANILKKMCDEKSFLKKYTQKNNIAYAKRLTEFLHSIRIYDIREIKREHCVQYLNFLVKQELKINTIRNRMGFLKQFLTFGVNIDLIDKNPFFMPRISSADNTSNIGTFNLEEVQQLIKNADKELRTYLIVAFFTGARTGEILGLTWGDINPDKDEINILRTKHANGDIGTPKTKTSKRTIDMLPIVKNELMCVYKGQKMDKFIFKTKRSTLINNFKKLCKRLNLPQHRLYDTRHTFASIMLSKGEEPMWVGVKMLGHKDLNMTFKIYTHYIPQSISNRARFLDNFDIESNTKSNTTLKQKLA